MTTMEPVDSGHIEAVGYDQDNESMIVRFKNGDEYAYNGVSFSQYESIRDAGSVGRALNMLGIRGQRC